VDGSREDVEMLLHSIRNAQETADAADPEPISMIAALESRLALLHGDTAAAIRLLRRSISRAPWSSSWYMPLADLAPQRKRLAELLSASGRHAEASRHIASFGRTWLVGDAVFYSAAEKLRKSWTR
jgi:hypothetical protein